MERITVGPGLRFWHQNKLFIILSETDGKLITEYIEQGLREVIERHKFETGVLSGKYILADQNPSLEESATEQLDMLGEIERRELDRRWAYIQALQTRLPEKPSRASIMQAITQVALKIGDDLPPSLRSYYRWLRAWRRGGETKAALVPNYAKRGPNRPARREDVRRLVIRILEEKYLVRECPTLVSVLPNIKAAIADYNKTLEIDDQVDVPSRSSVYRILKSLDPYEVMVKRRGKHAADQSYRSVGKGIEAQAPLDLVQIDHTVLDIQVVTTVRGIVARPTITVAIDVKTRMPFGIYVGFASPGYETVMQCLRNGILPKEEFLSKLNIQSGWPAWGLPRTIILDNGKEFHSKHLKEACGALGISIVYHPVRTPHYKGIVERFFRSLNDGLLTGLKGRTFSNIQQKGDYDPVKHAVVPFEAFEKALYQWVTDIHIRRFHTGIDDYPIEAWEREVQKYPLDLPPNPEKLLILLAEVAYRQLDNRGIQLANVTYNSQELTDYYRRLGRKQKVKVKIDPQDIGRVYVFNEEARQFINVPALDKKYHGCSKWQLQMAQAQVNLARKRGDKAYDTDRAFLEIRAQMDEASKGLKKKSNKRIARHSEYDVGVLGSVETAEPEYEIDESDFDASALIAEAERLGWDSFGDDEVLP